MTARAASMRAKVHTPPRPHWCWSRREANTGLSHLSKKSKLGWMGRLMSPPRAERVPRTTRGVDITQEGS